jgi:putative peptidoglycan lipid II flippase
LRTTLVLLLPLSLWMASVAEPTVRLIFQQGRFQPGDTLHTARLLQIFLATVFCWGIQQVLGRAFYARQDTVTPAVIGTLATLVSIPGYFWLTGQLQATGVALASAGSIALYTAALAVWWVHRFGGGALSGLARDISSLFGISLTAAVPSFYAARIPLPCFRDYPGLSALPAIALSGLVFGIVFVILSHFLLPAALGPLRARLPIRDRTPSKS